MSSQLGSSVQRTHAPVGRQTSPDDLGDDDRHGDVERDRDDESGLRHGDRRDAKEQSDNGREGDDHDSVACDSVNSGSQRVRSSTSYSHPSRPC